MRCGSENQKKKIIGGCSVTIVVILTLPCFVSFQSTHQDKCAPYHSANQLPVWEWKKNLRMPLHMFSETSHPILTECTCLYQCVSHHLQQSSTSKSTLKKTRRQKSPPMSSQQLTSWRRNQALTETPKKEILAFQLVLGHFNGGNSPFLRKTKIHASETTDIAWKTNKQTHTPLLNERSNDISALALFLLSTPSTPGPRLMWEKQHKHAFVRKHLSTCHITTLIQHKRKHVPENGAKEIPYRTEGDHSPCHT